MEVNRSAWRQWRTGALPEGAVFARASAAGGMTARGMRSCLALRVNHSLRLGAQARCRMTPLNAGLEPCPWRSQSSGAGSSSMSPACGTPLMRILAFRKSGPADLFQSPKSRMRTSAQVIRKGGSKCAFQQEKLERSLVRKPGREGKVGFPDGTFPFLHCCGTGVSVQGGHGAHVHVGWGRLFILLPFQFFLQAVGHVAEFFFLRSLRSIRSGSDGS